MDCITVAKMQQLEAASDAWGHSYQEMMTQAGTQAACIILDRFAPQGKRVLVLCGRGNNGGDGFVAALALARAGCRVAAALPLGEPTTPQALGAHARLEESGLVPMTTHPTDILDAIQKAELIIDALFGTGFRGEAAPQAARLMEEVNRSAAPVVSLDISSGVAADTGRYRSCIRSTLTIAFQALKPAHLVHWRGEYQQEVVIASIGTPPEVLASFDGLTQVVDKDYFAAHRPRRSPVGHKGTNGRLVVIAGSRDYRGAAALACQAALRAGVGYLHLLSVEEVCALAAARTPEAVCTPCPQEPDGTLGPRALDSILAALGRADGVLLGCGLGLTPGTAQVVGEVLQAATVPVVADADALGVLAQSPALLGEAKAPLMLTPHPGEFSRLFGVHIHEAAEAPLHWSETMAKQYGVTLALKGPFTALADPQGNTMAGFLGSSGLARAGSGDVLAGLMGAMAARGLPPLAAAACGLYLHGRAAQLAEERYTKEAMLPSDLAPLLTHVFREADEAN